MVNCRGKLSYPQIKSQECLGNGPQIGKDHLKSKKRFLGNAYALVNVDSSLRIVSINGKYLKQYKPTIHEIRIQ